MNKIIRLITGIIPSIVVLILIINSCKHENIDLSKYPAICFRKQILPIFTSNCVRSGCHDQTGEAGLILTNYSGIMEGIISGKPDDSKIYNSITSVWGNMMPPGRPLPQELRTLLRLWI